VQILCLLNFSAERANPRFAAAPSAASGVAGDGMSLATVALRTFRPRLPNESLMSSRFSDFKKAGHWPTLLAAFLYFDFSFMVWVALGPLILYIAKSLGLSVDDRFAIVAIPILAGAVLRVPLGALADHIGAKATGAGAQLVVIIAIAYAWLAGLHSKLELELLALALGVAGASFAVALPQAGRWYPPRYQGLVMGIAGAGNMGVVLETLTAPWLAEHFGWQNAFGCLLVFLVPTLIFYLLAAKDAPEMRQRASWRRYRALLADADSWRFMFFYFITFGGFVGLANALPLYFTLQFHVSGVAAGLIVAVIVLFGSAFRPLGGHIADRLGGIRTLLALFAVVSLAYLAVAFLPSGPAAAAPSGWGIATMPGIAWFAMLLFSAGVLALGMGNGAVFQLVPQRFRREIGIMTGLVGCAGGIGGFLLARVLGLSKVYSGDFTGGFILFSLLALFCLAGLTLVRKRWRASWGAVSGARV
jgi:MFS transporter, NNP family, nitrate/nitrite transporter